MPSRRHFPSLHTQPVSGLALVAAAALLVCAPAQAQAPSAAAAAAEQVWNLPAGPLGATLLEVARQSGRPISVPPDLVRGLSSPAVQGRYTPEQAARAALAGHALDLARTANGTLTVQARPAGAPAPEAAPGSALLPQVTVVAERERGAVTEGTGTYAAQAVSIGKGGVRSLREVPQTVSVITRQQMQDQALGSVSDALRQTPGVTLSSVSSELSGFQSRGYDMDTSYDGIGVSTGSGPDFQRSTLDDLSFVDRVEVLRGPAGLLRSGGQGAIGVGGMVNIVRKKPQREFALSGEATAGSWDERGGNVDVTGPLNAAGTVRGRAVVSGKDQDFFYGGHQKRYGAYGAIEADLTPQTLLSLTASHQDLKKAGQMGRIPRYVDRSLVTSDRSASFNADWEKITRRISTVAAELQHTFDNDWKLRIAGNHQSEDYEQQNSIISGFVGADDLATYRAARFPKDVSTNGYDLSISGPFRLWGRQHEFVLGMDGSGFVDKSPNYADGGTFPNQNIHRPDVRPSWAVERYRWDFAQRGIYSSARIQALENVTVVLGARSLRTFKYITSTDGPYPQPPLRASNETTPHGAVIWDLSGDLSLYASYAEQFQPQNYTTASGSVLPPKQGKQVEVGVKGEFLDKRLNASLALYRIREVNRPLWDPENSGCPPYGDCYIASGLVQSQGVEAEVSGSPLRGLQLIAGYTYNQNKYLEDDPERVGQQFNGRTPRHLFKLWGTYQFEGSGWTAGTGVIMQSSTFVSDLVRQGGYAVASASVGYRVSPKTSITLNVNNLFDRHYLQALNASSFNYFGAPRNASLTLRHRF